MSPVITEHHVTTKIISISLPFDLLRQVDYAALRLGITRSALIGQALDQVIAPLSELLRDTPDEPTPDDVLRLRGRSRDLIETRVKAALNRLEDDQ